MRNHFYLSIALLRDHNRVAQVARSTIDLDTVVQELFECGDVEDLIVGGLGGVDDELQS